MTLVRLAILKRTQKGRSDVTVRVGDFRVVAPEYGVLSVLLKEKFVDQEYYFQNSSDRPLIIDCGANIGISMLYFKSLFPNSTIHCFEPYPKAYQYLEKNIAINGLQHVVVHKFALSNVEGEIDLFIPANDNFINARINNPKAYLAVIFFDERFNYVADGSITVRVSQSGTGAAPLVITNVKAPKNGYAFIYVSNESDEMLYFDNLQVSHNRGRITEENHYYAFGLKITGIRSVKLADINEAGIDNKYLYNDKELFSEADLNLYNYGFRSYVEALADIGMKTDSKKSVTKVAGRTNYTTLAVLNNFEGKAGILIEFGSVQDPQNRAFLENNLPIIGYQVAMAIYKYLSCGQLPVIVK